jgi:glycosyltransferase involved in cell wall biosynthesis
MSSITASLIIAAFRSQTDQLGAAIDSALAQTDPGVEVLVSDDSPDDGLRQFVERFRDSRLRYNFNSPALGVAQNHWVSISHARGTFVGILNHDDLLDPKFVAVLTAPLLGNDTIGLSFCDHWVIDVRGRRLESESDEVSSRWGRTTLRAGVHRPFLDLLAGQTIPMAMGTVFRKSLLPGRLPDHAGPAYDLWLTYLLARTGSGAYYVPRRLSSWRTHAGNLTSQAGTDWLRGSADCWASIVDDPMCVAIGPVARAKAAKGFCGLAIRAVEEGKHAEAASLARRAMALHPSRKAGAAWLLSQFPSYLSRRLVVAARAR